MLYTNGKFQLSQFKKIISLFNINNESLKNINGIVDLNTQFKFDINNRFKIKNPSTLTKGTIKYLETEIIGKKIFKKYIPSFNSKLVIKDTEIDFINTKKQQILNLKGLIKTKNTFDNFIIKEKYFYEKKRFEIDLALHVSVNNVKRANL